MKLLSSIKWKLTWWKLRLTCAKIDIKNAHLRRKYCRYGYHKLSIGYVGYGGTGQRMKHIHFLKCAHCDYIFFAKKSDKERYLRYQRRHGEGLKRCFSALLEGSSGTESKRLKGQVSQKVGNASVRRHASKSKRGGKNGG